jgi:hypothetical protein
VGSADLGGSGLWGLQVGGDKWAPSRRASLKHRAGKGHTRVSVPASQGSNRGSVAGREAPRPRRPAPPGAPNPPASCAHGPHPQQHESRSTGGGRPPACSRGAKDGRGVGGRPSCSKAERLPTPTQPAGLAPMPSCASCCPLGLERGAAALRWPLQAPPGPRRPAPPQKDAGRAEHEARVARRGGIKAHMVAHQRTWAGRQAGGSRGAGGPARVRGGANQASGRGL